MRAQQRWPLLHIDFNTEFGANLPMESFWAKLPADWAKCRKEQKIKSKARQKFAQLVVLRSSQRVAYASGAALFADSLQTRWRGTVDAAGAGLSLIAF